MNKLLFLFFILLTVGACKSHSAENEMLRQQLDSLRAANDSLKTALAGFLSSATADTMNRGRNFAALKRRGVYDPEAFVEESLRKQPQLIPLEAILGGTMYFVEIRVLDDEWVMAEYEDGHIMGKSIFQYSVNDKGEIKFVLNSSKEY